MHASLTPRSNICLIALWAVVCALAAIFDWRPFLWVFYVAGVLLGGVAGNLQLQALRESRESLIIAKSAMSVRRALQKSPSGKMYLAVFWIGSIVIVVLAFLICHDGVLTAWAAGYCSFALVRELITLPGTYALQRLETAKDASA